MEKEKKEYLNVAIDVVLMQDDAIKTSTLLASKDNDGNWAWGDNE